MYYKTEFPSPIGNLTLASDGEALVGLWLEGQKYFGGSIPGKMTRKDDLPVFVLAKDWLGRYFAGDRPEIREIPLRPMGSEFRQKVWEELSRISYGETTTYGAIAKALGINSAHAVGGAVGHNPISIIIPCHRVLGADGSLTGYAGGVRNKEWLLRHEGVRI